MTSESPFGKPLHASILAEPPQPGNKPLPVAALVATAIPAAAFAGAALLQRAAASPGVGGDVAGRWLLLSCGIGFLLGVFASLALGRTLPRRALWIAWGALAPMLIALLVVVVVRGVHPVREMISDRAEARCRLSRKVCTATEFRSVCSASGRGPAAQARAEAWLGAPTQSLCGEEGCTQRWVYAGPWTPDNWVAPGSIVCSVVTYPNGVAQRSSMVTGNEAP